MSVVTSINLRVSAVDSTSTGLSQPVANHILEFLLDMLSGTVAAKCDLAYSETGSLVATTKAFDLIGTLKTALGANFDCANVCLIAIKHMGTTGALEVGNGTNPAYANLFGAAAHTIKVQPGGVWIWVAPGVLPACLDVDPGTADNLKIDSGAATIPYQILILGRSA